VHGRDAEGDISAPWLTGRMVAVATSTVLASTTSESTADFPRGRRVRVRQDQSVGPAGTRIEALEPAGHPPGGRHTASAANTRSGKALMTRTAVSVRLIAGAPVALVDHARAERPGLDQV